MAKHFRVTVFANFTTEIVDTILLNESRLHRLLFNVVEQNTGCLLSAAGSAEFYIDRAIEGYKPRIEYRPKHSTKLVIFELEYNEKGFSHEKE